MDSDQLIDKHSDSDKLSDSDKHSDSDKLSDSDQFSDSDKHSDSDQFSDSDKHSDSDQFSDSDKLSDSDQLSDSDKLSDSDQLIGSDLLADGVELKSQNNVVFALRTTRKNHQHRMGILLDTWIAHTNPYQVWKNCSNGMDVVKVYLLVYSELQWKVFCHHFIHVPHPIILCHFCMWSP